MSAELPYRDARDPEWERGIDALSWMQHQDETAFKRGDCPRCGHPVCFVEGQLPRPERDGDPEQGMFEECNCEVRHPGTPEGRMGCGANGLIRRAAGPAQR